MDDEREVVCGRVEVVVHQALGNIERAHVAAFEASFCDELVHADAVKWNVISIAQFREQVVRVQDRILCDVFQPVGSMHGDVGKGADETAAEMSVEGFHASDGLGRFDKAIQRRLSLITFFDDANQWLRQKVG